jgi:hypothetical protein
VASKPISDEAILAAARIHHRLHCAACGLHSGRGCDGGPDELDQEAARMIIAAALQTALAEKS